MSQKKTSVTLSTAAFQQLCGQYVCAACCVRERMPSNLDPDNDSYCVTCYHSGTRRTDDARHELVQCEHRARVYREQRPLREAPPERPLPRPSTLLTDRTAGALWFGGTGRQLIRDPPINGATYTYSEINGLLKTVENFFYNCTTDLQVMYSVEEDISRPWDLARVECFHHFGPDAAAILQDHYDEQLAEYDPLAEPDEEGDSDCELED